MKRIGWMLVFGLVLTMFAASANAESPREQLKQMVGQLQQNPGDDALREQIIKLVQTLKPAPSVPEEAIEFEGRAQFAFKNAKSNDDYLAAALEYEKAVAKAPWVSGYYSDLCTIYEKAGKFEDAKRNCEFSLIGLSDFAQITDIKRRIAGLKYGVEQNGIEQNKKENAAKKLAGVWAIAGNDKDEGPRRVGGALLATWSLRESGPNQITMTPFMTINFNNIPVPANSNGNFRFNGAVDGVTIMGKILLYGYHCPDHEYEVRGEVLRDGVLVLQFYQDYIQNVEGADGTNCGRKDWQRKLYFYRQ